MRKAAIIVTKVSYETSLKLLRWKDVSCSADSAVSSCWESSRWDGELPRGVEAKG